MEIRGVFDYCVGGGCLDGRVFPDRRPVLEGLLLEGLQLRGGGFVNSSLSVRAVGSQVSKRGVGHENIYCVLAHLSELLCVESG